MWNINLVILNTPSSQIRAISRREVSDAHRKTGFAEFLESSGREVFSFTQVAHRLP